MPPKRSTFSYKDVFYPRIALASGQADAITKISTGTIVLIRSQGVAKSVKFLCPCGCGQTLSISLVEGVGRAWECSYRHGRGISLYPSVWLDIGCKSHFILRDNTARMLFGVMPKMKPEEQEVWWESRSKEHPSSPDGLDIVG